MTEYDPVLVARGKVAYYSRPDQKDAHAKLLEAKRELALAKASRTMKELSRELAALGTDTPRLEEAFRAAGAVFPDQLMSAADAQREFGLTAHAWRTTIKDNPNAVPVEVGGREFYVRSDLRKLFPSDDQLV